MKFKRSAFGYKATDVEDYIDELTERHDVELEHKDIEIRRLKTSIEQAQQRSSEFDSTVTKIQQLESTNAELLSRLEEARQGTAQYQAELTQVRTQLHEIETSLRERDVKHEEQRLELATLRAQVASLPGLESMLAEKDVLLSRYEKDIAAGKSLIQANNDLRLALDEKDTVIQELNDRIVEMESELSESRSLASRYSAAAEAPALQESMDDLRGMYSLTSQTSSGNALSPNNETVDELSEYLNLVSSELSSTTLPKTANEWDDFRRMVFALRGHLANLATEVSTYRKQERAIARALVQAEMKAAEMEKDALEDIIRKKESLETELDVRKDELEVTKRTMAKFRNEMQSVLEAYKQRLVLPSLDNVDTPDESMGASTDKTIVE